MNVSSKTRPPNGQIETGLDDPDRIRTDRNVWNAHASSWSQVRSPLRPAAEDVDLMRMRLGDRPGHGLLLGATTELRQLSTRLTAVDYSPAMIERWRRDKGRGSGQVIRDSDWFEMSGIFPPAIFDFAVGDGCLNVVPFSEGQRALMAELGTVLRDGAPFVVRLFTAPPPSKAETIGSLMREAAAGRIGSFYPFKWRFIHALLAERGHPAIAVTEILSAFDAAIPDRGRLASMTGWPIDEIDTIDAYAGSDDISSFPTLDEFGAILPWPWRIEHVSHGSYELAERCPVITMRRG